MGAGYAQWAKIFNLKEAAKTLIFLKENGIDSYEDLVKKSSSASGDFAARTKRIRETEMRQKKLPSFKNKSGLTEKPATFTPSTKRQDGTGASTIFTLPTSF